MLSTIKQSQKLPPPPCSQQPYPLEEGNERTHHEIPDFDEPRGPWCRLPQHPGPRPLRIHPVRGPRGTPREGPPVRPQTSRSGRRRCRLKPVPDQSVLRGVVLVPESRCQLPVRRSTGDHRWFGVEGRHCNSPTVEPSQSPIRPHLEPENNGATPSGARCLHPVLRLHQSRTRRLALRLINYFHLTFE